MRYIFIIGCGRSGTHFVRDILNMHPNIFISRELHYFSSFFHNGLIKATKYLFPFDSDEKVQELFSILKENKIFGTHWQTKTLNFEIIINEFYNSNRSYQELYKILLNERTNAKGKNIGGEKTPSNLFHIGRINKWLPNSKFVHLIRDPRAIFVSEIYKKEKPDYFVSKKNPLYNFGLFIYVIWEWFFAIEIHKKMQRKHLNNYRMIKYKDLVLYPNEIISELCNFLSISFEVFMLDPLRTNSSFDSDYDVLNGWRNKIPKIYKVLFSTLLYTKIKKYV